MKYFRLSLNAGVFAKFSGTILVLFYFSRLLTSPSALSLSPANRHLFQLRLGINSGADLSTVIGVLSEVRVVNGSKG
jgi:hypothetical protein